MTLRTFVNKVGGALERRELDAARKGHFHRASVIALLTLGFLRACRIYIRVRLWLMGHDWKSLT